RRSSGSIITAMGYVHENLITDEHVSYQARLHWILFLRPFFISLALVALAVLFFYMSGRADANLVNVLTLVGMSLIVIAVFPFIGAWIERASSEFAVTNKRVILKTGFIQKKTAEMFLNKIESVGVEQSITARIFGYGTIIIRGTGGSL